MSTNLEKQTWGRCISGLESSEASKTKDLASCSVNGHSRSGVNRRITSVYKAKRGSAVQNITLRSVSDKAVGWLIAGLDRRYE
jgi:hypothetical protein